MNIFCLACSVTLIELNSLWQSSYMLHWIALEGIVNSRDLLNYYFKAELQQEYASQS